MKTHGFIPAYPLHVVRNGDGKLKIKAGHHRFDVAKKLGLAVWYVICDDSAGIHELEVPTGLWKFRDYMASFCRIGSEPHLAIAEYADRTGISMMQAASMLAGESASSGNQLVHVKKGTFLVKDTAHAELVGKIIVGCKDCGVTFATNSNFVSAVSSIAKLAEFDADNFLHKVAMNPGMMKKQATMAQFVDMIDAVYNYHAKHKIALAFLAREAARNRAAVKR